MGPIGKGGGRGGPELLGPPLQNFTGPLLRKFKISSESSAQAQSIGTLFEQIGLRSADMSKSQRHTHSGAGRGVSQANEAAINPKLTGWASTR